jgi:hypothetical protein
LDNPLPDFFLRLEEASAASAAVDDFDVNSADPASAATFAKLVAEQAEAAVELVRYVQEQGEAIIAALSSPPV